MAISVLKDVYLHEMFCGIQTCDSSGSLPTGIVKLLISIAQTLARTTSSTKSNGFPPPLLINVISASLLFTTRLTLLPGNRSLVLRKGIPDSSL